MSTAALDAYYRALVSGKNEEQAINLALGALQLEYETAAKPWQAKLARARERRRTTAAVAISNAIEWIDCDKRLPAIDQPVLIAIDDGSSPRICEAKRQLAHSNSPTAWAWSTAKGQVAPKLVSRWLDN